MFFLMFISENVKYIGVNDHDIDLFEGQYDVPNGMAYNSYAVIGEKTAIMDSVDAAFTSQWLDNINKAFFGETEETKYSAYGARPFGQYCCFCSGLS